jgi:DinB family protein
MDAVELLRFQLDAAFSMLHERVADLTDEEFWWEPSPDVWTIRELPDGRWAADYDEPDPVPAPLTTIGWRIVHILECKLMYDEYAFGEGRLRWDRDISSPRSAAEALQALDTNHARLASSVAELNEHDLDRQVMTNWGERWPAWRIIWTMIEHDLWHGGEIGALRDLYRSTRETGIA